VITTFSGRTELHVAENYYHVPGRCKTICSFYTFFKKIGFSCNENLTGRTHPVISPQIARVNHFLFWNIFMFFGIQQMFDYLWAVFRIGK
jgi:hypothetical protein